MTTSAHFLNIGIPRGEFLKKLIREIVVSSRNLPEQPTQIFKHIQAIRLGGFELEVNKCVNCGSKRNIVAFSFVEGGFICQNCLGEGIERDLNKNQMVLIRKIFNTRDLHLLDSASNYDETYILFRKFIEFIEEAFGYHFKNLRLLLD